ncbi:MAG: hypothetical protein JW913_20295 [Chitinispirillaceae bacterium]|nr:hypothetical protein [Chitinispirillaceae bacterium]
MIEKVDRPRNRSGQEETVGGLISRNRAEILKALVLSTLLFRSRRREKQVPSIEQNSC